MRIDCPYCGERDARRVRLSRRRRASSGRDPARSRMPRKRLATTTSICATIRPGRTRELWYHAGGLPRLARRRRATRARTRSVASRPRAQTRRPAEPPLMRSAPTGAARRSASPRGGLIDRTQHAVASPSTARAIAAIPATRWPRRCWRTACAWSGARFKYHRPRGILTAGLGGAERAGRAAQRRAARAEHARDRRSSCIDGLVAASQNRWPSLALRSAGGQRAARAAASARASTTRPSCGRRRSGRSSTSR